MKITRHIKEFLYKGLVLTGQLYGCYIPIYYSCPISAVTTNEQLGEKRTCGKYLIDIPKTEGLVRVYIDE